ncbi:alkaline phosphatase family protein [Niabella hirudinis]|uniref:alkaline phosphatase family protein n=1 Tax=Niabella hirudinis TaxID=1285929 RepID=UPI003EC01B4B
MHLQKTIGKLGFGLFCCFLLAACNKTFDNGLKSAEENDPPAQKVSKVLFVMADGLVGTEIKQINPPTLSSMVNNAIYSYNSINSITDDSITNEKGWATLLTGVTSSKHQVINNLTDPNDLAHYPTLLTRIKAAGTGIKSVSIATNQAFSDVLQRDADEKFVFAANDEQASAKATDVLAQTTAGLVMVQLGGADAAGRQYGYAAGVSQYTQAVAKIDGYISQFLNTLKNRGNYDNENWLVVVASNKGSNQRFTPTVGTWNAFDDAMHNNFIVFYNPRFLTSPSSRPVGILPYTGQTPAYTIAGSQPTNNGGYVPDAQLGSLMDFGPGSEFTMQCKIKLPAGTTRSYPSFLGKRNTFNTGATNAGFLFFLEGAYWGMNVNGGGSNMQSMGTDINDGKWHTLTAVVRNESDGVRRVVAYTDGARTTKVTNTVAASVDFSNNVDFTVGWRDGGGGSQLAGVNITDIRVYNTALSEAYIGSNFCKTDAAATDPYRNNMVGFWPNTSLGFFINESKWISPDFTGRGNHMIQKSGPATISFYETSNLICPPVSVAMYEAVPNSVDVTSQIFAWLGISPASDWGLDGKGWIPKYIDVEN